MGRRVAKTLTILAVKAARGNGVTRQEIPDAALPGLYLVIQPSGGKSWALRYRLHGKPSKLTLGSVLVEREQVLEVDPPIGSAMTLPEARTAARQTLQVLAEGRDPTAYKKASIEAAAATREADKDYLAEVQAERFIERYAKPKNKNWKEVDRQFRKEIVGFVDEMGKETKGPWRGRDVRDLKKSDIVKLLDGIIDRGSPITANRIYASLNTWFSWLVSRDVIKVSPMAGIKKQVIESARDRVLSDDELIAFWKATEKAAYPFLQFWRLLLLTGQRRNEVAGMHWKEITLGNEQGWLIPKERTKNGKPHYVPLSLAAVNLLESIPRIGKQQLVFTTTGDTAISGFSRSKARLDKDMLEALRDGVDSPDDIDLPQWGLHDLRRTAASRMAGLRINIAVVEKVLNHTSGTFAGITAVYQRHDFADEKRVALDSWADLLMVLVGEKEPSNVIRLEQAAS